MRCWRSWSGAAALAPAVLITSCGVLGTKAPPREEVLPLLEREAQTLKQRGENDVDPSLGVKITWNLRGVEVREQPDNEAYPWAGNIRFEIVSLMRELDKPVTHKFDKEFQYLWDQQTAGWIPQ